MDKKNELLNMNGCGVENLQMEELQMMQEEIFKARMNIFTQKLKEIQDSQDKIKEEMNLQKDETRLETDKMKAEIKGEMKELESVVVAKKRLNDQSLDYISQNDFGSAFDVKIGSVTVGKLFKTIGIAKPSKGRTEPYMKFISKFAITDPIQTPYGEKINYKWHYRKCLKAVELWLDRKELKHKFYSFTNSKDLTKFVNGLYDTYISN